VNPVVLLTDFGLSDHYVGVLHAVLVREAPGVQRIDLGHEIDLGDVWAASYLLRCAWNDLPSESVVLAVVDPGVGGNRRPLAVLVRDRWLVAPDNGLPAALGGVERVFALDWRMMDLAEPSDTFHGRDLFAPAAARIARGDAPRSLGHDVSVTDLVPCPIPEPIQSDGRWRATVIHVDRFGDLITNQPADRVHGGIVEHPDAGRPARRVATYDDGGDGELLLLEGSTGLFELAVRGASAAGLTGLTRGDSVVIEES